MFTNKYEFKLKFVEQARFFFYLHLSFSATKGRNSCAAGVRPDAPLFHHDFLIGPCKSNRSSPDSGVCLLGCEFQMFALMQRADGDNKTASIREDDLLGTDLR